MKSIWTMKTILDEQPTLEHNIETDTVVIGAGMAGILTAYKLHEKGVKCIVIDANSTASGQTQNTTAKITAQHGLIYNYLIENFGIDKAAQYKNANFNAIDKFKRIIKNNNIDCDFQILPAYIYSKKDEKKIELEFKAAKELDIDAEFCHDTSLPFSVTAALKFNNQAQFNPLKFIKAISKNLTIFEKCIALKIESNKVICKNCEITAKNIVLACHFPFINFPGYYFLRMHQQRSYVLALENAQLLDGMYIGIDDDALSFRNYKNFLLLGGMGHRSGENSTGGNYDRLRQEANKLFENSKEVSYWSAQDCMTLDSIPYIGKYAQSMPNTYIATGFCKWGMTSSMVSAEIISDMIVGKSNKNSEVFSPQRFKISASVKGLIDESSHAIKGLSKQSFKIPKGKIDSLPNGHGGIVEYEGEKAGVYKNDNGEVFIINPKCPHFKCLLEWNKDELTWDCPCHGSRFDIYGNLINGPATENLINY